MRKATTSTEAKLKAILKEANRAYDELQDHIEQHELEAFIRPGYDINGTLIETDENITPEQVSIIGGYCVLGRLKENIEAIAEGADPQYAQGDKTEVQVTAIEIDKDGKQRIIKDKSMLPPEVKAAMKKLIKEMEQE